LLAVEWSWLLIPLLGLLPATGVAGGLVVGRRSGWSSLLEGAFAWAFIGFLLYGVVLPGASTPDGAGIALFLFLVPWLISGSLVLIVREHRHGRRAATHR